MDSLVKLKSRVSIRIGIFNYIQNPTPSAGGGGVYANRVQGQASGGGQVMSMGAPVTGWVRARWVDHSAGEQSALLP